jgi:hypothetical protein
MDEIPPNQTVGEEQKISDQNVADENDKQAAVVQNASQDDTKLKEETQIISTPQNPQTDSLADLSQNLDNSEQINPSTQTDEKIVEISEKMQPSSTSQQESTKPKSITPNNSEKYLTLESLSNNLTHSSSSKDVQNFTLPSSLQSPIRPPSSTQSQPQSPTQQEVAVHKKLLEILEAQSKICSENLLHLLRTLQHNMHSVLFSHSYIFFQISGMGVKYLEAHKQSTESVTEAVSQSVEEMSNFIGKCKTLNEDLKSVEILYAQMYFSYYLTKYFTEES